PKLRALLAILLLNANQDVTSDRRIELLWAGQPPPSAAKSLQVHVSRLRQALARDRDEPDQRLVTTHQGYRLRVSPGELDVERFELLIAEADELIAQRRWEAAADRLRRSLELWRGDPLSDFAYESFAQSEIARVSELHVGALKRRVAVELSLGHEIAVIGELERLVREHPYHEHLHGQLMLALYRAGRQADALAAFREARAQLSDELGIEPSAELAQLHSAILAQDRSLDRVPGERGEPEHPTNLPAQTRPLIGRRDEQAEVRARLRSGGGSVITLTGIGGIGKTRLATAVAGAMLDEFAGGVFLVRFAGVGEPRSILPMIAEAIGLTGGTNEPLQTLLPNRLGKLATLLILDNLEQLVDGAPIVGDLVARAAELRILVTSQVPLRIGSEVVVQLGPLHSGDASALFLERLRARDWQFSAEAHEQAIIASICERVDGMPLAIELAAARAHGLGLRELERRLEAPLGLLTRGDRDLPERQRSLRAAIEWSRSLLRPEDNALYVALGACTGPVPLGMVAALADSSAAEPAMLDRLDALLESSFIRRREDPRLGARFMMPQALRNHAAERLAESGTETIIRRRHARYVAEVAYAARLWKEGATEEQLAGLRAVEAEIRPAVAWAREHEPSLHVRICAGAAVFWIYRSVIPEVIDEA
ncbi:MAG: BTAD domain-containing putative transcriptional regulator, partial [Solirubrobacteraceae bacterium]